MASLQIGKYKRPGIFIEEYDQSVIASQTVQGIVNTVIGVSKKGPINTPVLIQNTTDLQNIFGSIDRNLERKGSYFHRTIAKMLESSPVYAINLLATDDTLDKIEYAPLSTSSDKTNDAVKTGAYRRFFNNTGFWKRDPDSFLTLAATNPNYLDRIFNITNMSSNYITVFVFKTTATGFDRTMLDWYGSVERIPQYLYPTDYASDYMVDVVVLAGDWSDYQALSVDSKWSKYFDSTGLRKTQVQNFVNDNNVTLLKYYQGLSFIPYFRDSNNQNIFIETVINKDTDMTGLFCAFNMDAFETDYPNGKIDLIGNNLVKSDTLVDENVTSVDFLSYNEIITEYISYSNRLLDTPGNVISITDGTYSGFRNNNISSTHRTDWYSEDGIFGVYRSYTNINSSSATINFDITDPNNGVDTQAYAMIGGNQVMVTSTYSFVVNASDYGSFSTTASYFVGFKLDSTGSISKVTTNVADTKPTVASSDLVLGYMNLTLQGGHIVSATSSYTDLSVSSNISASYIDLINGIDYTVTSAGSNNTFTITFLDTASAPSTSNYSQYRRIRRFLKLQSVLESTNLYKVAFLADLQDSNGYQKVSMKGMSVTTVTSTTSNKSITIKTNLGVSEGVFSTIVASIADQLCFYVIDNELIFSDYELLTTNLATSTLVGTSSFGIVSKYSALYENFYNGIINTGDYFYANVLGSDEGDVYVGGVTVDFITDSGNPYIVLTGTTSTAYLPIGVETYRNLSVPSSVYNTGTLVITDTTNFAASLGYDDSYTYAYKLQDAVTTETIMDVNTIYDASTKYYLSLYLDGSDNLTLKVTQNDLTSWQEGLILPINQTWKVKSNKSNYEQTLEIVTPTGYTRVPNKILVDSTRYSEILVGDFLEAYVDQDLISETGQYPKRLTRILKKQLYSGDTTLVEITCDSRIFTETVGSKEQATKYSSLDNYITTYKAIPLKGFRIREASLPDGTDTRQTEILNLVAKGSPLFRAITNKEAFDFRYLVDSFGLGLTEYSKQQLMDICGERLNCLGFLNMPSIKQFKNSSSPSFVNAEGVLQTSYIASGGDPESSPAFLYSFGEGRGTTCVGYFLPYLTVDDNGRPLSVPPAMFAASTYMRKLNTNVTSIVPWTIAAGVTDGRITGISGIEMDFDITDIENLNGASMNPIVVKKNRGWVIETENTAQTLYKSALSYLHVRELLIELENELTEMLKNFQWKFNTADTRAEIKLRADVICASYVNRNGLYNYFNKCDSENNTSELIDNQIGVLDTYVEPIKGLQVIVNNITVLKTGAIQSGGFATL